MAGGARTSWLCFDHGYAVVELKCGICACVYVLVTIPKCGLHEALVV